MGRFAKPFGRHDRPDQGMGIEEQPHAGKVDPPNMPWSSSSLQRRSSTVGVCPSGPVRRAGELAQAYSLRGYDAVHLAAASAVADSDVVLVTGDADLANAANSIGIAVSITNK